MDLQRVTPEKLMEMSGELSRRAAMIQGDKGVRDVISKSLLPALQRMERAEVELQKAVDELIDRYAEVEKCRGIAMRIVKEILGRDDS